MIGLSLALRITLFAICIILLVLVVRLIGQGRLQVRYSLLWIVLMVLMFICAIFPGFVGAVSNFLGFEYPSNFVFCIGLAILLAICLSLSMVVSWQARYIRSLIQSVSLLENRISKLEERDEEHGEGVSSDEETPQ